jgi:hypothetical protein
VGQGGDNLSLDRDSMRVDLVVECFAEGNCIFGFPDLEYGLVVEPEMEFIRKVRSR